MARPQKRDIWFSILYSIPWACMMWLAEDTLGGHWSFVPVVLAMAVTGLLAYDCGKRKSIVPVYIGNIVSCVLSTALLYLAMNNGLQLEVFWPHQWAFFFLFLTAPVQAFAWNKYWAWLIVYIAGIVGVVWYLFYLA